MALANTLRGKSLFIQVGDGEESEAFAHPCLINTERGIVFSAETSETRIPDCADPELMAWANREKVTLSAQISGAGTLHTDDVSDTYDWFTGSDTRNCRVLMNGVALAEGGGHWAGAFHLTGFEVTGTPGELVQCSMTMPSSGAVTWVDASA